MGMAWGWILFEIACNVVDISITLCFAYWMFREGIGRRVPWGKTLSFLIAGVVWSSLYMVVNMPVPDMVPAIAVSFLYSYFALRANIGSSLLWAVVSSLIAGLIWFTTSTLFSLYAEVPIAVFIESGPLRVELVTLIFLTRIFLAVILIWVFAKRTSYFHLRLGWVGIIAVPIFSITLLFFVMGHQIPGSDYLLPPFLNVLLGVGLFGINIGLICFIIVLQKRVEETLLLAAHNQALGMQLRQQEEMGVIYRDMRRIQHDFKHHLHTIQGLVTMRDLGALEAYLSKITDAVTELLPGIQTDNPLVDALLSAKLGRAKAQQIRIDADIQLSPNLPFDADKLCVLLGNLIDNATDAAMHLPAEDRWVKISLHVRKENFIIDIQNATDDVEFKKGTSRYTRKEHPEYHGFGLPSVDHVVAEYEGFCERWHEGGVFSTLVILPLPFAYVQMLSTNKNAKMDEHGV
jgi:hypothetical protein